MTATTTNYEELILEGITQAGGQPEDVEFVKPEWLRELGARAADAGAKKRMKFPSFMVTPISDIEDGIRRGHYTDHYNHITNKTVKLKKVAKPKRVFVVPFNRTISETEYPTLLGEYGLKPCVDGPNYLAGLMAQVPESDMPVELKDKYVVAAEPDNASSVFLDRSGRRCFLCVSRGGANRELNLTLVGYWGWDAYWGFLAELA